MASGLLRFTDNCAVFVDIDTTDNSVVKAVIIDSDGAETPIVYETSESDGTEPTGTEPDGTEPTGTEPAGGGE